jgi:hypothetical protein
MGIAVDAAGVIWRVGPGGALTEIGVSGGGGAPPTLTLGAEAGYPPNTALPEGWWLGIVDTTGAPYIVWSDGTLMTNAALNYYPITIT